MRQLEGIIVPLITPLNEAGDLDTASLEALIKHVRAGGVHGFFLLGSTGEGPSLGLGLRKKLVHETLQIIKGELPILVGVTDTAMENVISVAKEAAKSKADAIVLAPSPYFPTSQGEFLQYIRDVAAQVSIPLFLYNNPSLTKVNIDPTTVLEASKINEVIGIKDSSGSLEYFESLSDTVSDTKMTLLTGSETLFTESLKMGAHGGIFGMANLFPKIFSDLYRAYKGSDERTVSSLQEEIIHIRSVLYNRKYSHSSPITTLKCALSKLALCREVLAPPLYPALPEDQEKIFNVLESLV